MIRLIKAEFQKILSIRSTYTILAFCLAITILFAFYIEGYKLTANVTDSGLLESEVTSAVSALAFFISLVGVLLVTHEYRYNTIMYTLTASNSRLKVLLAKIVAVSVFSILITLLFSALSPLLTYAGVHLKGLTMVHQVIPVSDLLWRVVFFGWAYSMLGVFLAFIIRNQIGAIVTLLLFPTTGEALLGGLLLKEKAGYLPFTALSRIVDNASPLVKISHSEAALVATMYVIVAAIVAAVLFMRRDAN